MKWGITCIFSLIILSANSCSTGSQNDSAVFVEDADYIQIVLFHLAQRCESCEAVERETLWLLDNEYREEVLAGKIRFIPLNFQNKEGKKAAGILRASGQTLYVVKGDSKADLTSAAFMYASTHPGHYRDALRQELDQYLE